MPIMTDGEGAVTAAIIGVIIITAGTVVTVTQVITDRMAATVTVTIIQHHVGRTIANSIRTMV